MLDNIRVEMIISLLKNFSEFFFMIKCFFYNILWLFLFRKILYNK